MKKVFGEEEECKVFCERSWICSSGSSPNLSIKTALLAANLLSANIRGLAAWGCTREGNEQLKPRSLTCCQKDRNVKLLFIIPTSLVCQSYIVSINSCALWFGVLAGETVNVYFSNCIFSYLAFPLKSMMVSHSLGRAAQLEVFLLFTKASKLP